MSGPDWVPASCVLPTAERPLRVVEWDGLFAGRLEGLSRPEPLRVRLVLRGGDGVEERVRDLAGREGDCCSFFAFAVAADRGAVVLDVAVDAAVLEALERRAAAVGGLR
ncbi:hypothetical protein HUT16_02855 [Kitasatospora sp. NA04385]|uniref:hypothetical protein n=1 Tax=Kitasatospora sp. NA04385 TaxID=2742135 RepID=UPI001590060F|nr:hypothetical protein [Kitasatospora sp. NA04385]QKW18141.1 hypothetical protein HUT16_02855 [Kitasatospora sp. NA04385]